MHAQPCPPCLLAQVEGRADVTEPMRVRFTPQRGTSDALKDSATTMVPCLGKTWTGRVWAAPSSPFRFSACGPCQVVHHRSTSRAGPFDQGAPRASRGAWMAGCTLAMAVGVGTRTAPLLPSCTASSRHQTHLVSHQASRVTHKSLEAQTPHVMAGTGQQHPMHRCSCRVLAL